MGSYGSLACRAYLDTGTGTSEAVFCLLAIRGPTRGEGKRGIEPGSSDPKSSPLPLRHRGGQFDSEMWAVEHSSANFWSQMSWRRFVPKLVFKCFSQISYRISVECFNQKLIEAFGVEMWLTLYIPNNQDLTESSGIKSWLKLSVSKVDSESWKRNGRRRRNSRVFTKFRVYIIRGVNQKVNFLWSRPKWRLARSSVKAR